MLQRVNLCCSATFVKSGWLMAVDSMSIRCDVGWRTPTAIAPTVCNATANAHGYGTSETPFRRMSRLMTGPPAINSEGRALPHLPFGGYQQREGMTG